MITNEKKCSRIIEGKEIDKWKHKEGGIELSRKFQFDNVEGNVTGK